MAICLMNEADINGRYYTVLRLALPRTSIRDITYKGTVIPKGTVFFLNSWACNMGKTLPFLQDDCIKPPEDGQADPS